MTTPQQPQREHPSTYFVQDRSNEEELKRLLIQDRLVTAGMGGVLPEQSNATAFKRTLDVACGTGGWLIEAARSYPNISMLIGVDVSTRMIAYAREQAELQQMSKRVEFHTMDALRMLEFPRNYFDLVNQRMGSSYLRTWDWPNLLLEFQRVTRPGGVIRCTEANMVIESSSPALTQLFEMQVDAGYRSGHLFTFDRSSIIDNLESLLKRYGLQNVQTQLHKLEYRAGTAETQALYENMKRIFRTILPFFQKWTRVPTNYQEIYQHALDDMQRPDFVATWTLLTAWGDKSNLA